MVKITSKEFEQTTEFYDKLSLFLETEAKERKKIPKTVKVNFENDFAEIIENANVSKGIDVYRQKIPRQDLRVPIIKGLYALCYSDDLRFEVVITDCNTGATFDDVIKNSTYKKRSKFGSAEKRICEQWIQSETGIAPQLVGEFTGCHADGRESKLFATLLTGEKITIDYDEVKFQERINAIHLHDLIRIMGIYQRAPGKRTRGKITRLEDVRTLDSEFKLTFEEYRARFLDDPDCGKPEFEEYLKSVFQSLKDNFGVLQVLGEKI